MTTLSIQPPVPLINDIDGQPLEDGYIWIGVANLPPIGNPVSVYWDAALTQPAALPVRTRGGYPVNNGTPARLYVGSDYSIQVQNKNGSVIYSAPVATERYSGVVVEISSTDVSFLQAGTGAVTRTAQSKMRDVVSVFDFMTVAEQQDVASGTGALNVTAAINAAINYVKISALSEKELDFPAGLYRVTQFNFTGVNRCTFRALGTVQIYGNGTADFVFGCDGYVASGNPDADSTFSNGNKFIGGEWLIGNTGGTYTHNFKFTAATGCVFENFSVSGSCGAASGANRIAAAINFCWVNRFIRFSVGSPGAPGVGFRSFNIAVGPLSGNNVNNNVFESCRIQAGSIGAPYSNTVGISLQNGNANKINTCDISALAVGIEISNERGLVAEANYHEYCTQSVIRLASGNSRGNVFIGGIYEVMSNAAAFTLDSSQNTTIIGGRYFGTSGGSNRTFIAQGSGCYGIFVVSPELQNIDNNLTGTYNGASTVSGSRILQAQWLSFPSTQVASTDANTLDDYEEGTWTPASNGDSFSSASGRYTKVGDLVIATFQVQYPTTSNTSSAQITGWPFSASGANSEHNGFAAGYNTSSIALGGSLAGSTFNFRRNGSTSSVLNSNLSGAFISGAFTYKTAT